MPTSKIVETSREDAAPETLHALDTITELQRFIEGLKQYTGRELAKYPPLDEEPIKNMGIAMVSGPDKIRIWINNDYRKPKGKRVLKKGEVKDTTKFKELKKLAGIGL